MLHFPFDSAYAWWYRVVRVRGHADPVACVRRCAALGVCNLQPDGGGALIQIEIPGWRRLELERLFLDLNGTICVDGLVLPGVIEQLDRLSQHVAILLLTADTRGKAADVGRQLRVEIARIEPGGEGDQKRVLVERLGAGRAVAIGNGANDAQMLRTAALGIAVLGREGLAVEAFQAADVVVATVVDGLDLLLNPARLVATLRR